MNILYVSVQCSKKKFEQLFQNKESIPGQQTQKYNRLLAEGLSMCDNTKVYALTSVPVTRENCVRRFLGADDEMIEYLHYHYLPAISIHCIRDILTVIFSFFYSLWSIPKHHIDMVIMDVLAAPVALGSYCAARFWQRKIINIVTDLPNILFTHGDQAYHIVSNYLIKNAGGYVFLTQQMNDYIKNETKPYVIIEGLVDYEEEEDKHYEDRNDTANKRIILYSGTIHKQYGIKALTEGFIDAELDNAELHIYGEGDYKEELTEVCKQHINIKFFGCVLNSDMTKLQKQATILINPRSPREEFTKYSFPSKNMEYLLSGVPVMAALLPGMPEEYRDYMYIIEDCSHVGICRALREVLSKPSEELHKMGQRAQQFVLKEKNKMVQAEKALLHFESHQM